MSYDAPLEPPARAVYTHASSSVAPFRHSTSDAITSTITITITIIIIIVMVCTGTHSCNSHTTLIGLIRIMYEFGGLNL